MVAEAGSKLMASKHISLYPRPLLLETQPSGLSVLRSVADTMKALKLRSLLEGEALAVWMELSEAEKEDYKSAKLK